MSIAIACPSCNARLRLPSSSSVSKARCPYCNVTFPLHASASTPQEIVKAGQLVVSKKAVDESNRTPAALTATSKIPVTATIILIGSVLAVGSYWLGSRARDVAKGSVEGAASTATTLPRTVPKSDSPPQSSKPVQSPPSPTSLPALKADELFARYSRSVVKLICKNDSGITVSGGSGFLVAPGTIAGRNSTDSDPSLAYVVTNHHVIESATEVQIEFDDGSTSVATSVLLEDPDADLALLAAEVANHARTGLELASTAPAIGSTVYAIGSPKGLSNTLSDGIISGKREIVAGNTWLQTTAPISPGSSGCPVFSVTGTVVGVAVANRRDGQNLNFVIPTSTVANFLQVPFKRRPVWHGRSIEKEAQQTAIELAGHMSSSIRGSTKAESDAFADCQNAWTAIGNIDSVQLKPDSALLHLERLKRHEWKIEADWKFWYWFIVGMLHNRAAFPIPGESQAISNERISRHRLSAQECFLKTINERSDFAPAYECLFYITSGEAAEKWSDLQTSKVTSRKEDEHKAITKKESDELRSQSRQIALKIIELRPYCSNGYFMYGTAMATPPDSDELVSIDMYRKAIELEPTEATYYSSLGRILVQSEKYADAESVLKTGLTATSPDQNDKAMLLLNLGNAFFGQRQFKNARTAFEQARQIIQPYLAFMCEDRIRQCDEEIRNQ